MAFLPLRELEPFAGSSSARLLPHHRARDAEPHRAGLTGEPAADHTRLHVERPERVGRGERLLNVRHERRPREIVAQRPPVDAPLARPRRQIHARDAELAASDRVPAQLRCDPAAHLASTAASGVGCCAACGCSGPAYTLSICFTCWRDKVVFGNIPHTAFSMTRSGCFPSTFWTGVNRSCPM